MTDERDDTITLDRSVIVDFMRANWQDPVGFHEAIAAQLGIDEDEYAPKDPVPTELSTARALVTIATYRELVESTPAREPIPGRRDEVVRKLIRASRMLDADKTTDPQEREVIDRARAWLAANGLPTEYRA